MSGIHYLVEDDFILKQGDRGAVLSLMYETKGLALILFYSADPRDNPQDSLINKFKMLPNYINGCQFGMVNISRNMNIIEKSKNTIAPIAFVPDLLLYVNGFPYVRYDGIFNIQQISEFIMDVSQKIKNTAFVSNQKREAKPQPEKVVEAQKIPAFTIGTPLYGEKKKDKVCYLNFNNAYVGSTNKI